MRVMVMDMNHARYTKKESMGNTEFLDWLNEPRPGWSKVRWININGMSWDVIKAISIKYTVEDLLHVPQRTKVDIYPEHTYIACTLLTLMETLEDGELKLVDPSSNEHKIDPDMLNQRFPLDKLDHFKYQFPINDVMGGLQVQMEQVTMFLMQDGVLITLFQVSGSTVVAPITERLTQDFSIVRKNNDASFLLQSVMDGIVDHAIPIMDAFRQEINELEAHVLALPRMKYTRELHQMTAQLSMLKRTLAPTQALVHALRGSDDRSPLSSLSKTYMGDVMDHCNTMVEDIDSMLSLCEKLIDMIFNIIAYDTNESMRRLALVSIIFLPITFIAGVYGTNFKDFPELSHTFNIISQMPAKKVSLLSSWTKFGLVAVVLMQATVPSNLALAAPAPSTGNPTGALLGVVQRLLPQSYHNAFDFQLVSDIPVPTPDNKYDVFRVSNKNSTSASGSILIEGTTLSALGRGLKYYLDQAVQVELAWSGNRFDELPKVPPRVPDLELDTNKVVTTGHVRGSFVPWRYYTNVVTYGYQFPFWEWKRWEREIDWMVLNGINLLPAMVGQEYVVREFWRSKNVPDNDIIDFLSAPVDMPWQRMGNIQGSWNYQLLNSSIENERVYKSLWIDAQWDLQKLIISRIKDLGITAILPAFQSFVPRAVAQQFPNNVFENASLWSFFPEEYTEVTYVSQTDSLFANFSVDYLELQKNLYNGYETHYYLLDLFNELVPDCTTPECLKDISTSVTKVLQRADKDAIWVMQGWFLTNTTLWTPEVTSAYFEGISAANGTPFILDLAADSMPLWNTNNGFYGHEFGWSVINNFGTAQGLFAQLSIVLTDPFKAYQQYPTYLKGIGVASEGINNNEYLYITVLELPWHDPKEIINGTSHLEAFIKRRYGASRATPLVQDAWDKLRQTVWNQVGQASQSKSYVEKLPALNMTSTDWLGTVFNYNKTIVAHAWDQLVRAATQEHHANIPDSYKFDLVDTTREVLLATVFQALHEGLVDGYQSNDVKKIQAYGRQIISLIYDADTLLNTNPLFSFGAWVLEAKTSIDPVGGNINKHLPFNSSRPGSPNKAGYLHFLESNARDIFTWWGPEGSGPPGSLPDYASKQWGGMLTSFYLPRWQLFISQLEQAVKTKQPWNSDDYLNKTLVREAQWQTQVWGRRPGETWTTNGKDSVEVVRELHSKWAKLAFKVAAGGKA
ncbi:hypothetical protein BGZ46_005399 [Entomortierella lignicola]|nr:hypothetical protein BGZ46_005399 [Entomortierella lignicola]